jgi:Domain of unknown function (DUF4145)
MSAMACPNCGACATFSVVWKTGSFSTNTVSGKGYDAAFRCNNPECALVVGDVMTPDAKEGVINFWPRHAAGKGFPDVPQSIAAAADEAYRCLSIGAHRAAIATARAVVEATAKDHEVTKGNLENKIDELAKMGVIGTDTAESCACSAAMGQRRGAR